MLMPERLVRKKAVGTAWMMSSGGRRIAGAGRTGLRIDENRAFHPAGTNQRMKRQNRCGCETPGIRDVSCRADLLPIDLGDSVDEALLQLRRLPWHAVIVLEDARIVDSKVSAQI